MLWSWWAIMAATGFLLGALGAWTTGPWRSFMNTLAIPIALVISRLAFPAKESPYYLGYLLLDLAIVSILAYLGNYFLNWTLDRSDRGAYRNDSMGH